MIKAACPRCSVRGRSGLAWQATGHFVTRRLATSFMCAELTCQTPGCGARWTTGCVDAVAAGQAARASQGREPYALGEDDAATVASTEAVRVPAPTLFPGLPKQSQGFVKAGAIGGGRSAQQLVQSFAGVDVKTRQSGDTE